MVILFKKIRWFWGESRKYREPNPIKLLSKGFIFKCIWFLFQCKNDRKDVWERTEIKPYKTWEYKRVEKELSHVLEPKAI